MEYTDYPENLEKIKIAVEVFNDIKRSEEYLFKKVISAGHTQRNALISHVYSNYTQHELLIKYKNKWEQISLEYNVVSRLWIHLAKYRDLYGYFPKYKEMIAAFDDLLYYSIITEEFEIAAILFNWRKRFPNP